MNRIIHLSLALIVFSLVSHGHHDVDHHHDHHDPKAAIKIQRNVADFATEFYKLLAARSHEENIVFSPCSIFILLSVLLLGTESNTHAEILNGLGFNLTHIQEDEIHQGAHELLHQLKHSENDYKLDIGQGLFLKEDIEPLQKFIDKIKEFYDAEIQATKFQEPREAEKQINGYIKEKTHGKIAELVKDLDPETVFVLTNYIFFKGNWKTPFESEFTREEDFFVDHNTTVKVQMMHRTGWFYSYYDRQLSCTVVRIDYNGTATTFFVLPDPKKEKELDEALSVDTLTKWAKNAHRGTAMVSIPKFGISATYSLKEPLSQIGITEIFTNHANLTGVTGQPLKLSKITHKAVLTVDETGAEAAGATAAEAIPMSLPPDYRFNHPFLIFIFDSTVNTTLFVAKIKNPTQP
ncbi:alpha-1-antitrypsin-like [Ahaetulla prasina]|uniref:alpha-1-antitrypsin-like n=1 Tax=Ahaetulla prasina TaxID=499056 RepID=UPI002648EADB|nr:alpha-1-antitrypsin-like [Ahaetulla prasina]